MNPPHHERTAIAELDTTSGVLRWVNAGHPAPLLIRDQQVTRTLVSETTLPVGFDGAAPLVAREQLQPGDRVLFFTDGATEQRTHSGTRIGDALFEDLAERACNSGVMVAETVRRLVESLLDQTPARNPTTTPPSCCSSGPAPAS